MVMNTIPPPPRPKAPSEPPVVTAVLYGLAKRSDPDDPPFYALAQEHCESSVGRKFWQGIAIEPAAKRRRRFETDKDAMIEAEHFKTLGIRVDGIIKVTPFGQELVGWTHFEKPPEDPDAGSW